MPDLFNTTRVVNLRHEAYDVYIGRAGHGQDGYFGNPHDTSELCRACSRVHPKGGGDAIDAYRSYFLVRIEADPEFKSRILSLRGKILGCFCKTKKGTGLCHGDVIVEWLKEYSHNAGTAT